jgi:hypothetical protein
LRAVVTAPRLSPFFIGISRLIDRNERCVVVLQRLLLLPAWDRRTALGTIRLYSWRLIYRLRHVVLPSKHTVWIHTSRSIYIVLATRQSVPQIFQILWQPDRLQQLGIAAFFLRVLLRFHHKSERFHFGLQLWGPEKLVGCGSILRIDLDHARYQLD